MAGTPWTVAEERYVRANFRRKSASEIAKHLGRTPSMVYQKAAALGLSQKRPPITDEQLKPIIRSEHPRGLADREIAAVIEQQTGFKVDRHRISRLRKELGLESNKCSAHRREQARQRTAGQLEAAGLENLGALRSGRWDKWKRDLGWPEHLTLRAVQALEMFYRLGPMTRLQLCKVLGVTSKKRYAPISRGPGGTVLAELSHYGLISCCPKAIPTKGQASDGRGRCANLYFLSPGVEPDHGKRKVPSDNAVGCQQAD